MAGGLMRTIEPPRVSEANNKSRYQIRCDNHRCAALLEIPYAELDFFVARGDSAWYQLRCVHCHIITSIAPEALFLYQVADYDGKPMGRKSSITWETPMLATLQFIWNALRKIKRLMQR